MVSWVPSIDETRNWRPLLHDPWQELQPLPGVHGRPHVSVPTTLYTHAYSILYTTQVRRRVRARDRRAAREQLDPS